MFEPGKFDLAAYSHFFGSFGPGVPGGTEEPSDNGTSAAAPLAAGEPRPRAYPGLFMRWLLTTPAGIDGPPAGHDLHRRRFALPTEAARPRPLRSSAHLAPGAWAASAGLAPGGA